MRNEEIGVGNGSATIEPADPVTAGSTGAWAITYVAGPEGIAVGGSVRFEIPYGFTPPQIKWPHDAGYCSATCSRPGTRLALSLEPPVTLDPEPFYYVTRWGRMVYVRVLGEALQEGDSIAFQYGRRPQMEPGVLVQHFAGEVEFTVATDVDGRRSAKFSGYTLIAEQPRLAVVGGLVDKLAVFVPSYVEIGEPFRARVIPRDAERNLSSEPLGDIGVETTEAAVDVTGPIEEPCGQAFEMVLELPGEKLVAAVDVRKNVTGLSNPLVCLDHPREENLFWGDIHGHTILSDGLGTPEEYYEFGRDEACLDVCAIADHSQYLSDEDWEYIQQATDAYYNPGEFVTLLGYEYSLNANMPHYGDKCLYYPGDSGPLLRATDIVRSRYTEMADFAPLWKEHGAMMILHQHASGTCSFHDPDLVRLAEVYSIWGASENAQSMRPLLPALERDYTGQYAADALAKGWILGFIGASDDHAGRPGCTDWLRVRRAYPGGLAGIWAPDLTREAIWDALWNRRCYATSGERIILEFSVDGEPMGSIISGSAFSGNHLLEVRVVGKAPLASIEVLRGREIIYAYTSYSTSVRFEFMDEPPPGAGNYYYVRVTQVDGEMAWSSPVWVG